MYRENCNLICEQKLALVILQVLVLRAQRVFPFDREINDRIYHKSEHQKHLRDHEFPVILFVRFILVCVCFF